MSQDVTADPVALYMSDTHTQRHTQRNPHRYAQVLRASAPLQPD